MIQTLYHQAQSLVTIQVTPFWLKFPQEIAGVGNLWHACQTWHVEQFSMAR